MTRTKEKNELAVKETTRPESRFDEVESYVNRLFRHPFSMMSPSLVFKDFPEFDELTPSVDVFEEEDKLVLKADLPGIRKEDLNITITENRITLSGEKEQEEKVEKKDYHWCERTYGSFCRSFRLPDNVNADEAEASFKDGVLEIRIPKTEEIKKQKKITVK
ncbi:MAG: Hsp20/alpha crystallin family protein [Desulfobulbaceae bacterium]|nr:Hsp20/alpha crystallin family protein [Desulfobulbaceae bacterium]